MATTPWVSAAEVCSALGLSRHQLRQAVKRGDLRAGLHYMPGPTPNSPRRYNLAAVSQLLLGEAQLRNDSGAVFPPLPPPRTALQALEVDQAADAIRLHDGSGNPPTVAQLGGLPGMFALADLLGEISRQGRRAAAQGLPLSAARAACPALGLTAAITPEGLVELSLAGRSLAMPLCEVLDLQGGLCRLLASGLQEQAGQRARLEQLLAASTAEAEGVRRG
jgi:hypothetical protein